MPRNRDCRRQGGKLDQESENKLLVADANIAVAGALQPVDADIGRKFVGDHMVSGILRGGNRDNLHSTVVSNLAAEAETEVEEVPYDTAEDREPQNRLVDNTDLLEPDDMDLAGSIHDWSFEYLGDQLRSYSFAFWQADKKHCSVGGSCDFGSACQLLNHFSDAVLDRVVICDMCKLTKGFCLQEGPNHATVTDSTVVHSCACATL